MRVRLPQPDGSLGHGGRQAGYLPIVHADVSREDLTLYHAGSTAQLGWFHAGSAKSLLREAV